MAYKILFGIPAMFAPKCVPLTEKGYVEDYEVEDYEINNPEFDIWFDFSLEYDYKEDYYYLTFETFLCFNEKDDCRAWIEHFLDELTDYMERHGYDTSKELNMFEVFTEGANVLDHFKTVEDAYAALKLAVHGFHGIGLEG